MNIITAGLNHESNTFNPIITDSIDFNIYRGNEIFDGMKTYECARGIIETLQNSNGYKVIPTLFAKAVPNGEINSQLYYSLKREMLEMMKEIDNPYAITLALHGSMRVVGLGEAEGDLLEAIRALFPQVSIVVALDMHASVSEKMLSNANAFCGYKQAPHTDCFETGVLAAEITKKTLETGKSLTMACHRIPMLIAGEKSETGTKPMKQLINELRESEKKEEILAASYLLGFPWADSEDNCVTSLVVTLDDQDCADREAQILASKFWAERENFQFHTDTFEPGEALEKALNAKEAPIYLSDSGDNPTAGSSGDCTGFLELILNHRRVEELETPLLYAGIYDPQAVETCLKVRIGEEFTLTFGAAFDKVTTKPLRRKGRLVSAIKNWGDYHTNMVLFRTANTEIIIVSRHIGFIGPDMFYALGIDPLERKIIAVKLGYLTAPHKKIAAKTFMALSSGSSNEILESLSYKKIRRPLFPLDKGAVLQE